MLPGRQPTKCVCSVICDFLHTLHTPLKKLQLRYTWWRFFFCLFVKVQKVSTTGQRWGQLLTSLHHPGSPCHAIIAKGIVCLPNCTMNLWGSWTSEGWSVLAKATQLGDKAAWTWTKVLQIWPWYFEFYYSCCFHSIILSRNWNIFLKYTFYLGIWLDLQKRCKDSTEGSVYSSPNSPWCYSFITLPHC